MKENGNKRLRILSIILVVVLHIALITCVSPGGSTYGLSWALSVAYTLSLFFTAFVFGKSWAFLVLATAYWGLLLVSFWLALYVPDDKLLFPVDTHRCARQLPPLHHPFYPSYLRPELYILLGGKYGHEPAGKKGRAGG